MDNVTGDLGINQGQGHIDNYDSIFFVLIKLMNWWNKGQLNNIKYYTLFYCGRNKLMLVVTWYLIGWNKKNLYNQISLLNWHQICINPLTVTFEFVQLDVQWFD